MIPYAWRGFWPKVLIVSLAFIFGLLAKPT